MDFFYNILVTGCSSGLGKALFNEVHSHDHLRAFAHYRSMTADPFALYGDVNDFNFPDKLDEFIRTRQIECFINNAGVYEGNVLETNLLSQVKMLQVVYEYFAEQKKGRIININSLAGINPTAGESLYCASKFGLKGFSQSLQLEAIGSGVEITDVYLGGVQTRITEGRDNYDSLMKADDVASQIIDLVNTKSYYVNELILRKRNESSSS